MILDLIFNRRSTVAFSPGTVEPEKIQLIFEAAQLAPSSMNLQPWRYIYATQDKQEDFKRLFDCLDEGNKRWVKNAYMLILSVAQMSYIYKNEHYNNKYAMHDTGTAMGMLMIQAAAMGLVSHPMGGYDSKKARANLNIPDDFEPVAMIAVGYPGPVDRLPEDLLKRETSARKRKPLNEAVFFGKYGSSSFRNEPG